MAYISQERKKQMQAKIAPLLKEYGVKATLSIENHSVLNLNIKNASLDFIGNYNEIAKKFNRRERNENIQVIASYVSEKGNSWFSGRPLEFLQKAFAILMDGNHDNSEIMNDYHDVGWYAYVNIGQWDRPFVLTA